MTRILYGARGSGACAVECALAEIGAAYELREVDLRTDEQRGPEYEAVNPQRKVPTLILEDGETLTESATILLTLEERHPEGGLLPARGSPMRAQALRWLMFIATELYPVVEINDYPERFSPEPGRAEATRELARDIWRTRWRLVEENVAGDPFLLRGGFCLTDVYVAVVSRWAQQGEWRPAHLPKVERLTAAVAARPAIAPIWKRHFGAMP